MLLFIIDVGSLGVAVSVASGVQDSAHSFVSEKREREAAHHLGKPLQAMWVVAAHVFCSSKTSKATVVPCSLHFLAQKGTFCSL